MKKELLVIALGVGIALALGLQPPRQQAATDEEATVANAKSDQAPGKAGGAVGN